MGDDRGVLVEVMSAELASRLASADLTYEAVGATKGAPPAGYRPLRVSRLVGSGADAFVAATSALRNWQVHRRAGLRVTASAPIAAPGAVVLMHLGAGPLRIG